MALLMMVPVGAMAEDGADPDNPLTGDIGYKTFNTPNGSVYLNGVTGGQLHILAEGVTIYVAGNNSLKGSTRSHPALELGHSGISTNNSLTIKYWNKAFHSYQKTKQYMKAAQRWLLIPQWK